MHTQPGDQEKEKKEGGGRLRLLASVEFFPTFLIPRCECGTNGLSCDQMATQTTWQTTPF